MSFGSNLVNDSHFRACQTGGQFMVTKLKKRDWQNLTLFTLDREPCQLSVVANDSPFAVVFYGSIGSQKCAES